MRRHRDRNHDEEGVGKRIAAAEGEEAVVEADHRTRVGIGERAAADHHHDGERCDEGIDRSSVTSVPLRIPLKPPKHAAPAIARDNAVGQEHDRRDPAHRHHGADREIKAAGRS